MVCEPEAHLEPNQISTRELFSEKSSIIDVWIGSKCLFEHNFTLNTF